MAKSIIEEIVEEENKKKRLALKRKREMQKKRREREKLQQKKLEEELKKKEDKKKDMIPTYKHKIEENLQAQQSAQKGYNSLPVGFQVRDKSQKIDSSRNNEHLVEQQPQQFSITEDSTPSNQSIPSHTPEQDDKLANVRELLDIGTKENIHDFFQSAVRNSKIIYLPGINQSKCKFTDYGYRRLIEHIFENKDFLRIIVDTEDMQGVTFVTISGFIRPKDDPTDANDDKVIPAELTLRGLEGLCEILYRETAEFDPYENEWKHLNNLLGCFTQPEVKGKVRIWKIKTELTKIKLTAVNKEGSWIYKVIKNKT